MHCLFVACQWSGEPVAIRTDPYDASKVQLSIPLHEIVGPADWFARICPASMAHVPPRESDLAFLETSRQSYVNASVRRASGQTFAGPVWSAPPGVRYRDRSQTLDPNAGEDCPLCAAEGRTTMFYERLDLIIHMARDHNHDVRADIRRPHGGDVNSFFPVRPAESEADEQHPEPDPVPDTSRGGIFNVSDSNRSGLRSTLILAAQAASEASQTCANMTNNLDKLATDIERLAAQHQAAAAMATASVGGEAPETLPGPAQNMMSSAQQLGLLVTEMRSMIQALRTKNDQAYNNARTVETGANEYSNMI